jgi:hypothetical protein
MRIWDMGQKMPQFRYPLDDAHEFRAARRAVAGQSSGLSDA